MVLNEQANIQTPYALARMTFDELLGFIEHDMRMSHVYQPIMLRTLLDAGALANLRRTRHDTGLLDFG